MADTVQQSHHKDNNQSDVRKIRKSPEIQSQHVVPTSITRERSFVRSLNHQNTNKRRSLAFSLQTGINSQNVQMRSKPTMDIYRPPKLNYNLQHSSSTSMVFPINPPIGTQPQVPYVTTNNVMMNRRQADLSLGNVLLGNMNQQHHMAGRHRPILVAHSYSMPIEHMAHGVTQQVPSVNSPSSGNITHQTSNTNRVKFAPEPQKHHSSKFQTNMVQINNKLNQNHHQINIINSYNMGNNQIGSGPIVPYMNGTPLQRSKSMSSADALTRGIAGLGLGLGNEVTNIGQFTPEIQLLVDAAIEDPNKLNSRSLMELTSHFIKRAVEGRRYALPISRFCLNIIAKEHKETFLEALLNTCRQWYQEREKILFTIQGMKSPARSRFTAFMAFLTEMFCQLKRRQLQLRTQCEGAPPPLVLLTLLSKCCEDCVKPPVRSLSEIECLFYVLTCIGQDLEMQLPQQLEILLSMIRDAFLNANDAAAAIRRTLLQLIELQASHWQLPGNTVLYYYPSNK